MKLTQQLKAASASTNGGQKEAERLKKELDKCRRAAAPTTLLVPVH
jgi:hypothetical protein